MTAAAAYPTAAALCYPSPFSPAPVRAPQPRPYVFMIETNPIHAQIADLTGRVESLRGYL